MTMKTKEMVVCERCLQPISKETGRVEPGYGFQAFHPLCWEIAKRELFEDHIREDNHEQDYAEKPFEKALD